jgi:hypothetical protein
MVTILSGPATNSPRQVLSSDQALHTMTGLTSAQESVIHAGLDKFAGAGLKVPGIDFIGHEDQAHCNGRSGLAWRSGQDTKIHLCTRETGPAQEWMVLHEIAHTWDYFMLDDERRNALLELRGLEAWRAGEWHERGSEHSAEIMVWGTIGRPVRLIRFGDESCEELAASYRTLTGNEPARQCD